MNIRSERVADYSAIADIHARAFDHRTTEPVIVSLLRHRRAFDPELSLVAERDGRVVGHALFFPYTLRLLGSDVPAVNLAPIGVLPEFQNQGIGSLLIEEGHRVARARGYAVSFLLGHPWYYPRFGYRTNAYGQSQLTVRAGSLPAPTLVERAVTAGDIPALHDLWRRDEAQVDFTIDPGRELMDWISPNPAVDSVVYTRNDQIVGYARLHRDNLAHPRVFLATDGNAAQYVAGAIARRSAASELILPIHPRSTSASGFGAPHVETWPAAMAMSLVANPLDEYLTNSAEGSRPAGHIIWPVAFDL